MNREQAQQLMQRLVRCVETDISDDCNESMAEPSSFFTDEERWQRERQAFFFDTPQVIGFSGELHEPGSYLATESMGIPIVATRDEQGVLRAFINACAHRGASVAGGFGSARRLNCRFHGWSYGLDGQLVARPQEASFCQPKEDCGLTPLPISDRGGLLMVGLQADMHQSTVDHALDDIAGQFAGFEFEHKRSLQRDRIDVAANWKLVVNLSHESYHFGSLHRQSLSPLVTSHHIHDEFGLHTRWAFPFRDIEKQPDSVAGERPLRLPAVMNHTIFPGTVVIVNPGDLQMIRVEPGDRADTSVVYFCGVCDRDAASDPARLQTSRETYAFGLGIFCDEDLPAAEQCQRGINAGLGSVKIGANEPVVQMWHRRWHGELDK